MGHKLRRVATIVPVLIEAVHLAGPVNLVNHLPAGHNAGHIALVAGTVLIKEETGRTGLAHLGKHLFQHLGAVKEEYEHADIERFVRLVHRK